VGLVGLVEVEARCMVLGFILEWVWETGVVSGVAWERRPWAVVVRVQWKQRDGARELAMVEWFG